MVSVRIGSVVLNVQDVSRAAAFWRAALDYESDAANEAFLGARDGDGPRLHLDDSDRTHLDLWMVDTDDVEAEVDRLLALGAHRAEWQYPPDADFVVLADTEGNLFCVITR